MTNHESQIPVIEAERLARTYRLGSTEVQALRGVDLRDPWRVRGLDGAIGQRQIDAETERP
jgi:hypothetical protein